MGGDAARARPRRHAATAPYTREAGPSARATRPSRCQNSGVRTLRGLVQIGCDLVHDGVENPGLALRHLRRRRRSFGNASTRRSAGRRRRFPRRRPSRPGCCRPREPSRRRSRRNSPCAGRAGWRSRAAPVPAGSARRGEPASRRRTPPRRGGRTCRARRDRPRRRSPNRAPPSPNAARPRGPPREASTRFRVRARDGAAPGSAAPPAGGCGSRHGRWRGALLRLRGCSHPARPAAPRTSPPADRAPRRRRAARAPRT